MWRPASSFSEFNGGLDSWRPASSSRKVLVGEIEARSPDAAAGPSCSIPRPGDQAAGPIRNIARPADQAAGRSQNIARPADQAGNIFRSVDQASAPGRSIAREPSPMKESRFSIEAFACKIAREPKCNVDAETEVPEGLFNDLLRLGKEVRKRGQHVLVSQSQKYGGGVKLVLPERACQLRAREKRDASLLRRVGVAGA